MCAASEDGSKVTFVDPPGDAEIGERVMVLGYDGEPVSGILTSLYPLSFSLQCFFITNFF